MTKKKIKKIKPDKSKKIIEDIFESTELKLKKPVKKKKKKIKKLSKEAIAKRKATLAAKKRQKEFQAYINNLKKSYKKLLKEIGLYKTPSQKKAEKNKLKELEKKILKKERKAAELDLLVDDLFYYSKKSSNKPIINPMIFSKTIKELNKIIRKKPTKKKPKKRKK